MVRFVFKYAANLVRMDSNVNSLKFWDILDINLMYSNRKQKMYLRFFFRYNNAPKHFGKTKWFTKSKLQLPTCLS